jgi:hypothetical protein
MQMWRQTEHQAARERFVRLFTSHLAEIQVVINRIPERLFYFLNTSALERNDIPKIKYLSMEDTGLIVKLNVTRVAFVF